MEADVETEPRWLVRAAVEAIHESLVRQFGGSHGVRDDGLLESALDRARNRWGYGASADIFDLAASYGVGIAKNHAFVDGNKRTAFQTMYVFLGLNGRRVTAPQPDIVTLMVDVATGSVDEVALAAWLRANTSARDTEGTKL